MTTEFIFFADLVLALRLRWLLADAPVGWRGWLVKAAIETAALGVFVPQYFLLGAAGTNLALNLAAGLWEGHARDRNGGRLFWGALQIAAASVWFSAAGGVHFWPEIGQVGEWLGRWSALGGELQRMAGPTGLRRLLGLLIAANEANLLVRWVLVRLQIKPGNASLTAAGIDAGEFNRGRVIGLLERGLIYAFVLSGQYGAIGFTLAAKGFTRFKEMENRSFAEYVLIGTLLSSSIAMAIGAWVKFSL